MQAETKMIQTVAFAGMEVIDVQVQVQVTKGGRPLFVLVGLPDKAIAESRERIRSALSAMGVSLPAGRLTVNLSPADLQKEGSLYDVPIAVAILVALGVIDQEDVLPYIFIGELSLDGRFNPISGVLPTALHARSKNYGLVCPHSQSSEATWVSGVDVLGIKTLFDLVAHFQGNALLPFAPPPSQKEEDREVLPPFSIDMKKIKGQHMARRAIEIAAAGEHNILMSGSPGVGKSLLAKALIGILPPMTAEEMLEASLVYSFAGLLPEGGLIRQRPFRDPHHSASLPALVGGGANARPGEVSLAHKGVLFLDELPEFQRSVLESLRQPLENGVIQVSRAKAVYSYSAQTQLVAAMNPCRCGYLHDPNRVCSKAPMCAESYIQRISGPFLDRIDLFVEVPRLSLDQLNSQDDSESSKTVRKRVIAARELQHNRYKKAQSNARASFDVLEENLLADPKALSYLQEVAQKREFSMRAYHRCLRVARTISDLEGKESVSRQHIEEALIYRRILSLRYG